MEGVHPDYNTIQKLAGVLARVFRCMSHMFTSRSTCTSNPCTPYRPATPLRAALRLAVQPAVATPAGPTALLRPSVPLSDGQSSLQLQPLQTPPACSATPTPHSTLLPAG